MTTETKTDLASARDDLIAALRDWAAADAPAIGHQSADVAIRAKAAKAMQREAVRLADDLAELEDDTLEHRVTGGVHWLRNATVNMDDVRFDQYGIHAAERRVFDAAIARRDDREGFRRNERGLRERRLADGAWQAY